MHLQMVFVKEGRLGFVSDTRHVVGCQQTGLAGGLVFSLVDFFLSLKPVFRQGVPRKESPQLGVPPLQHQDHLLVGPVVHRDAPDLRDCHAHAAVLATALDAD